MGRIRKSAPSVTKNTNTALSQSVCNPLLCSMVRILPSQITHYYQQKSNCVSQAQQRMLEYIKTQTRRIQKHEIPAIRTQKPISRNNIQLVSRRCTGFDPTEGTARRLGLCRMACTVKMHGVRPD